MILATERLILRPWRQSDLAPVAAICADPEVMRFFHITRSRAQSDLWVARTQAHIDAHGFGIWAVELREGGDFIGFVGLSKVPDALTDHPEIEAVWTLGSAWWRQGYCVEAARAAIQDGFDRLGLDEIVAFTAALNTPSVAVMRKLGMRHDAHADFIHPWLPQGHPMAPHVFYRLPRPLARPLARPQKDPS